MTERSRMEIWVSPEERERIKERAATAGYKGRAWSTWARELLLGNKLPKPSGELYTILEVAEQAGISRGTVYNRIRDYDIETVQLGTNRIRITERGLAQLKRLEKEGSRT